MRFHFHLGFWETFGMKSDRFNVDKLMFRSVVFLKNKKYIIYEAGLDASGHLLIEAYDL